MSSHWAESAYLLGRRCYFSLGYGVLYSVVLFINLCLIIWLVLSHGHPQPHDLFIAMEILVTAALVAEVGFTFCSMQTRISLWFWFDASVALLCLVSLLFYLTRQQQEGELAELTIVFNLLRYTIQLLRIAVMLRHVSRKNQQLLAEQEMQMGSMISEDDEDEDRELGDGKKMSLV